MKTQLIRSTFLFFFGLICFGLQAQKTSFGSCFTLIAVGIIRSDASGELYDLNKFTCAHMTLPFGTYLKVTRMDNDQEVIVKVNDRGNFKAGRIIDLSKAAAQKIGLLQEGLTRVRLDIVEDPNLADRVVPKAAGQETAKGKKEVGFDWLPESFDATPTPTPKNTPETEDNIATQTKAAVPKEEAPAASKADGVVALQKLLIKKGTTEEEAPVLTAKGVEEIPESYDALVPADQIKEQYGVQVASFGNLDNANTYVEKLKAKGFSTVNINTIEKEGKKIHKICLGRFNNPQSARTYHQNLKAKYQMDGYVIKLIE
ncbi:MAG: septal ring lytic transglycosylase RlpA family protein [Bacteroidota bacterium]